MSQDPPLFETIFSIKLLRTVGALPFKLQRQENGKVAVGLMDWKVQLLLTLFFIALQCGLLSGCLYIVLFRIDMEFSNFFESLESFYGNTGKTVSQSLDGYIELITITFSFIVGIVTIIGLNVKRQDISSSFSCFNGYLHDSVAFQKYQRIWRIKYFGLGTVNVLFLMILNLALTLKFKENLVLDTISTVLMFITTFILTASLYVPQFGHFGIFAEFLLLVSSWMAVIKEKLDSTGHVLLQNTHELVKGLNNISSALSNCTFVSMIIWLINLILIVYRMVSTFISVDKLTDLDLVFAVAFSFMALQHLLFIYVMNVASQEILEKVQDLKRKMKGTNMEELMIQWEDKFESTSFVKSIIVDELDEFQGFDGNGYFTLGKAFFSSIVTNFLTYLIILIQTKLTLITSFDQMAIPHLD